MILMQSLQQAFIDDPARIVETGNRVHAAVAILLHEQKNGLEVLFIERAVNDNDYWSGNIGFPGGRMEEFDTSARQTAERETHEEVGLDLANARFIGRLSDYAPGGLHLVVSSFIYALPNKPELDTDPKEVASAFWFPMNELANPHRCTTVEFLFQNRTRRFQAVRLNHDNKQPLWGITYRLVRNMGKIIGPATGLRGGSYKDYINPTAI